MTEELKVEVVDTSKEGNDHPVIDSLNKTLFEVAGRIQPISDSWKPAQRILGVLERGGSPDEIDVADLKSIFEATGGTFISIVVGFD